MLSAYEEIRPPDEPTILWVARKRLDDAVRLGCKDKFGVNSLESHLWGARGEFLFAKYLDIPWRAGSGEWAIEDVGRYEVRAVAAGTRWYAKAKDNDPDDRAIALVLFVNSTRGRIAGWTLVSEIRRLGIRTDPNSRGAPAWFVRGAHLNDLLNPVFPETALALRSA